MPAPNPVVHTSRQLHIDAVQSVTSAKMVEEGRQWHPIIANSSSTLLLQLGHSKALQSRLHTILYYQKSHRDMGGDDDYVWTLAAWVKESLNSALTDHPLFAGRLRRGQDAGHTDGQLMIKYNDAGVRLVQAQAEITMSEFLSSKKSGGVDKREVALLAYWEGIDDKCVDFSPLVCVQVTSFKGDGYSVAMSCSLLLGDPLFLTRFFRLWAQIHNKMLTAGAFSKTLPIDHLSLFRRRGHNATHLRSFPLDDEDFTTAPGVYDDCDNKPGAMFNKQLLENGSSQLLRADDQVQENYGTLLASSCDMEATKKLVGEEVMSEVVEISFEEGNKPIHVSLHIEPAEGLVLHRHAIHPNNTAK